MTDEAKPGSDPVEIDSRKSPRHTLAMVPAGASLGILLILFGSIALAVLLSVMKRRAQAEDDHSAGSVAHAPEEFPAIFNVDFIEGLDQNSTEHFQVPPPPFSEGIYPCSECHGGPDSDVPPNPTVRKLEDPHEKIKLEHGGESRRCTDCHDLNNRDRLRLAYGTLVPFEESYRLCGQCHGDKYRDWRAGIHGKRTGYWNGAKRYLLCVHCHNSHSPRFKPIKPMPPPVKPMFVHRNRSSLKEKK